MEKFKKMLPHMVVLIVDFYILPVCIRDTGSGMLFLLLVIPFICCVNAVVYGVRCGFDIFFVFLSGLMFIPSLFIFYNESAWVYAVGYIVAALAGDAAGYFLKKIQEVKND